jgi:aryl carrier-like protein
MTGVGFDVYLRDVFSVLMSGGSVHVPPEAVQQDTHRWINWLNAERVTVLHTVPSLLASRLADSEPTEMVRTVRLVFFAGEILTAFLVDRARRLFPLARFVNLYGPTETTLAKCWHEIKDIESPIVPVGRPIPGAQVTILNPSGAVCWPGEVGEIYIRTPYRTLGEVRPSGALDSIFVQNPCENDPEDLVFRTGDLGRYRLDGSVEVLGRCDNQVKRNGVRLDLSELESSICGFEGISQCVVLYETVEGGSLDAYVMCSNPDISLQGLRQFLLERLSTAMLPNRFYSVEAIPLLNNGKVDRRALRSIKGALLESDSSQNLPLDTPLQLVMGLAWESITGKPCTSLADDFFALGGDSLMAMRLVSRLRELLQLDLSIAEVFDHPTLGSLCEHVLQCDDSDRTAKVAGIVLSVFAPVSSELASQPNATPEPGVRSLASVSGRFVSRSPSISPCTQLDRE